MATMPSTFSASPMMTTSTASPPPPYSAEDLDDNEGSDSEDEPAPVRITINASHVISGKQNIVPPPPLITPDVVNFASVLVNEMRQNNDRSAEQSSSMSPSSSSNRRRRHRSCMHLDFTINYDVRISGDRNVMGNVSIRPRPLPEFTTSRSTDTPASVKRKAEEDVEAANKKCCPES